MSIEFKDKSQIPEGQLDSYQEVTSGGEVVYKHKQYIELEKKAAESSKKAADLEGQIGTMGTTLESLKSSTERAEAEKQEQLLAAKQAASEEAKKVAESEYQAKYEKLKADGNSSEALKLELQKEQQEREGKLQAEIDKVKLALETANQERETARKERESERQLRLNQQVDSLADKVAKSITTPSKSEVLVDSLKARGFISIEGDAVVLKDSKGNVFSDSDVAGLSKALLEQVELYKDYAVVPANNGGSQATGNQRANNSISDDDWKNLSPAQKRDISLGRTNRTVN